FLSHLVELRDRLLRVVVAVLLIFLVMFPFQNQVYTFLAEPLMAHLPAGTSMIATEVASPFLTPMKLVFVAAIFLTMPFILYQFWAFVAPGLYKHEQRMVLPLVVSSTILFFVGIAFAYFVVFPLVFGFLTGTAPEGVAVMTDIGRYLDFVLTLFFAFGLAFEVPIATIILVWMGVTTPQKLSGKRPYIIVGAFVIGMFLTPPDIISQTLLAFPMWILFELGVVFSRYFVREAPTEEDEEAPAEATAATGEAPTAQRAAAAASDNPNEGVADAERFVPMTEEEMDAELEAIEAQEEALDALNGDGGGLAHEEEAAGEVLRREVAESKLRRVNDLRDQGDLDKARKLLYEILVEGDEDQVVVARNILAQLDAD
ncbi:MAG: twin-arginine translocase subunit TatC, partial [Pseudomonadota bacterium]